MHDMHMSTHSHASCKGLCLINWSLPLSGTSRVQISCITTPREKMSDLSVAPIPSSYTHSKRCQSAQKKWQFYQLDGCKGQCHPQMQGRQAKKLCDCSQNWDPGHSQCCSFCQVLMTMVGVVTFSGAALHPWGRQ